MTIRKKLSCVLITASLGVAPAICAANEGFDESDLLELYGEDETVSISTGTNKPIRLAPSVATVVTEEDILRSGATTLEELLEMVPGLHVSASKNFTMNPIFSIRGVHTSQNAQVLLLIDGTPMRQIFNGGRPGRFTWPINNIKRIEVIRGPGSAVFGADAFSGVINVISKGALDIDGVKVGGRAGSFGSQEFWLQYGTKLNNGWHFTSNIEYMTSDGDDDRIIDFDQQSFIDQFFPGEFSNAPGPLSTDYEVLTARFAAENERWNASFLTWQQIDSGVADGVLGALDPTGSSEGEYYILDLGHNTKLGEDWTLESKLSLSYYENLTKYTLLPAGTIVPILDGNISSLGLTGIVQFTDGVIGHPGGTEKKHSIELVGSNANIAGHSLRVSVGFAIQDGEAKERKNFGPGVITGLEGTVDGSLTDVTGTPNIFVADSDRDIWFASIQDEWTIANDWILTAGVRYDDYSDFGSTINPRAALVWATTYNLTSKFLYGRAFRAPSKVEQLSDNNPLLIGNPNIEPETIDTLEIAFNYKPIVDLELGLSMFYYEINDLIDFIPSPDLPTGAQQAQNAFAQEGHGFEIEAQYNFAGNFSAKGNYSWQDSKRGATNDSVADAPGQQLYVHLSWEPRPTWLADLHINVVLDREREAGDTRPDLGSLVLTNASVRKTNLFGNWEAALSLKNLFDANEYTPSGTAIPGDYPLAGRSIMMELNYHY